MSANHADRPCCRLAAEDLEMRYGSIRALKLNTTFSGNTIAVIGHNGAGKSTLIKALLRLLPSAKGRLQAYSASGAELLPERDMAFCPETGAVFADISVESYIKLWCRIKCGDPAYYRRAGSRYIELLMLKPLLGRLGRELSKGQRRRVQTAVGFLSAPKLFLIDEPFCGLDVQKTGRLSEVLFEAGKDMSFILASHRMDVVERLADCVIVLERGRLVASGSVPQVAQALCRRRVLVSNMSEREKVFAALKEHYPGCLVNWLGDQISVSGAELEPADLAGFVGRVDRNGVRVETGSPCLVDALNYHLREAERRALSEQD